MVRQCHQSYQHEFDRTPGGSGRQEGLACSGSWGHEESDMTKQQQQLDFSHFFGVTFGLPSSRSCFNIDSKINSKAYVFCSRRCPLELNV